MEGFRILSVICLNIKKCYIVIGNKEFWQREIALRTLFTNTGAAVVVPTTFGNYLEKILRYFKRYHFIVVFYLLIFCFHL